MFTAVSHNKRRLLRLLCCTSMLFSYCSTRSRGDILFHIFIFALKQSRLCPGGCFFPAVDESVMTNCLQRNGDHEYKDRAAEQRLGSTRKSVVPQKGKKAFFTLSFLHGKGDFAVNTLSRLCCFPAFPCASSGEVFPWAGWMMLEKGPSPWTLHL